MKHLKKFENNYNYNLYLNSDNYIWPNVSLIQDNKYVGYEQKKYDSKIEYLESTGTQYINTNIQGITKSDEFLITVACTDLSNSLACGWTANARWYDLNLYHGQKHKIELAWGPSNVALNIDSVPINEFHTYYTKVSNDKLHFYFDGIDKGNLNTSSIDTNNNFLLFARESSNGEVNSLGKLKIKEFMFKRNNNIICNFIPVRKNGVGYMYDKVSRRLFGNFGTGEFILGSDI